MSEPTWMKGTPRKILLATDLSGRCDRALDRAVALARQWNAAVLAVHVLEPDDDPLDRRRLRDVPSWRRPRDRASVVEAQLRQDILGDFAPISARVEAGDAATVIREIALREQCDLIVTGVAREDALGRHFLGSTVDELVRRSPVPVLVVKRRLRRAYGNVVVAVDFSESSRHALEAAARLFPASRLTLFHGFEVPFAGLLEKEKFRDDLRAVEREECDAFIARAALPEAAAGRIEAVVEHGNPAGLLCEFVTEKDVDLVVLGTHGRSALFQVFLGSVARRILEAVPGDVLVVREPRAA